MCRAAFARKHDLQRYFILNFIFTFYTYLNASHLRTLHSGNRPHECPICRQGFNRLDTLRKHLKSDEKQHLDLPEIKALLAKIEQARVVEEEELKKRKMDEFEAIHAHELLSHVQPTFHEFVGQTFEGEEMLNSVGATPQLLHLRDVEEQDEITWPGYLA